MFEKVYAIVLHVLAPRFYRVYGEEATRLVCDRLRDEQGLVLKIRLWLDLLTDLAVAVIRDSHFTRQELLSSGAIGHAINPVPSFATERGRLPHTAALLTGGALSLSIFAALPAFIGQGGRGQVPPPPSLFGILPSLPSTNPTSQSSRMPEQNRMTTYLQGVQAKDASSLIPVPSGPFGIGRIGYDWVDSSRPDRFSPKPSAHRELMVYFWYPTSTQSAAAKGPYLPGAQQMDALPEVQSQMRQVFGLRWPAIVSGAIFSHAVEGAPATNSPGPFPLIIFSHGLGTTGFNYTSLIEDLVSRGFVVASIEHTYVALAVRFPDKRVVSHQEAQDPPPPAGLTPVEEFKWMMPGIRDQISEGAADVRFVLDRLAAEKNDPGQFLLAGKIDLNRVAAMGHSAGAGFAARACQLDLRLKACVELDGGLLPITALPDFPDHMTLKQPLLYLEAYHPESQSAGTPAENAAYFKKKEEQLQACRPGSYDVVLRSPGLDHGSFTDFPLLFAGQDRFPQRNVALHNLDLVERYVREFLGKNLKDEKATLLKSGNSLVPEATVQQYGH